MIFFSPRHRGLTAAGVVALAAGCLVGCAPGPAPTPTPTSAFASEEAAFAAAEEVYRAYLEAEDAVGNGESGEDPESFLTGRALDDAAKTKKSFEEEGIRLVGMTTLDSFTAGTADIDGSVAKIIAIACINVSNSRVLDSSGSDITPPNRDDTWPLEITFIGDRSALLISESATTESAAC